jgi:hypothetical protein
MFAGWAHFVAPCVFLTINPIKTRSPFLWKLCNSDFNLQRYPNLGEAKAVMPNDFEMIKLVRTNLVAQAIFFRIILKLFRRRKKNIPYKRAAKGHRVLNGYAALLWGGGYQLGRSYQQKCGRNSTSLTDKRG